MAKVFNRVAGGGGSGVYASITVTGVSADGTVTVTTPKGVVKTGIYITGTQAWYFVGLDEFGMYTVTATEGSTTKTEDVLIDVVGNYVVEFTWELWLYRDGDACTDVTGGWFMSNNDAGDGVLTMDNQYMKITTSSIMYGLRISTRNMIDISNYSKAYIEWYGAPFKTYQNGRFRYATRNSSRDDRYTIQDFVYYEDGKIPTTKTIDVADISDASKSTLGYVVIDFFYVNAYVSKVWFE